MRRAALLALLPAVALAQSLPAYIGGKSVGRGSGPAAPATQRVAAFGDSITRGIDLDNNVTLGGGPYPVVMGRTLGAAFLVYNLGVGGETTATGAARFTSDVVGRGYRTVAVLQGVNDLNTTADTAQVICDRLRGMYAQATTSGMRVVAVTVLPFAGFFGWDTAKEARRAALNSCILASPGVVAVNAEPTFLDSAAATPKMKATLADPDGLHISQAGADALAALVTPAVQAP